MISCTAKFHRLTFYCNSTKQSSIQRGRYWPGKGWEYRYNFSPVVSIDLFLPMVKIRDILIVHSTCSFIPKMIHKQNISHNFERISRCKWPNIIFVYVLLLYKYAILACRSFISVWYLEMKVISYNILKPLILQIRKSREETKYLWEILDLNPLPWIYLLHNYDGIMQMIFFPWITLHNLSLLRII